MAETTDSGFSWESLFSKGIDYAIQREQREDAQAFEQKKLAAQTPIFVRNSDNKTVRAGTSGSFGGGGLSPMVLIAGLGVVALLVFALRR